MASDFSASLSSKKAAAPGSSELRKAMVKYNAFQEQLWARSRRSMAKLNRADELEGKELSAAKSDEERTYLGNLFGLRRRALDLQVKVGPAIWTGRVGNLKLPYGGIIFSWGDLIIR